MIKVLFLVIVFFTFVVSAKADINVVIVLDTTPVKQKTKQIDSLHNPKLATKRSLMVPGWGQVYNKQTWKVPIIYAALGITTYNFFNQLKTYNEVRFAFNAKYNARVNNDPSGLSSIKPYLAPIDESGLSVARRQVRQNLDYSVVFFLVFWGLNVADATVFGHLKNFDVGDNISGNINIGRSDVAMNNGLQLKLTLAKPKVKQLKYYFNNKK